jgi:hypothetical protein
MVVFPRRSGGQSQFSAYIKLEAKSRPDISELQAWILGHPGEDLSVSALAERMAMSIRILFLTSAHNSLSQRLWIELGERGHEIRVCGAATDEAMIAAVSREAPDLIIAPMLKIAIPEEVWSRHLCLIVHPGIKGDRGPSSLDWAIANHEKSWA